MNPHWSIVVPCLNEQGSLPLLLDSLERQEGVDRSRWELLIVDGGSSDATRSLGESRGARVVPSKPGRGRQMNTGAAAANGRRLLFLHADMQLAGDALLQAEALLDRPSVAAGCFEVRFDSRNPLLWGGRWKTHLWVAVAGFAPGDHGLFLSRDVFEQVGGYPELPILEDRHICKKLKKLGRIRVARAPALVSARRFQDQGTLVTYLRMAGVLAFDSFGAQPETLRSIYHGPPK